MHFTFTKKLLAKEIGGPNAFLSFLLQLALGTAVLAAILFQLKFLRHGFGTALDLSVAIAWTFFYPAIAFSRLKERILPYGEQANYIRNAGLIITSCCYLGILCLICFTALPSDRGYPPKAHLSEAKTALSSIVAAEKSFYSEYASFSVSLEKIGFSREGARRFYSIGFPLACLKKLGVSTQAGISPMQNSPFGLERESEVMNLFRTLRKPEDCKDPAKGYEAFAVGIIRKGAPLDVWKIDETGKIEYLQSGL
jgi:hypothetical protein